MNTWFTSDQHFGHEAIIGYCDRPFPNSVEMDEALIKNYNKLVQDNDVVYFLGDTGWNKQGSLKRIIERLKGRKILILGNHCSAGRNTYLNMGFNAVLDNATISIGKHRVSMAHHPTRTYSELFRLFCLYTKKMLLKGKGPIAIYQRLKREWEHYVPFKSDYHLCGHIHLAFVTRGKNINVGVDVRDFKPIDIKDISIIIDNLQRNKNV